MDVVTRLEAYPTPRHGSVVSIGNFDGVHLGHQRMLATAREVADRLGIPLVVQTFEPHPIASLRPNEVPSRIISHQRKLDLLAELGVDTVIVIGPDADFLRLTPDAFIERLMSHCAVKAIVEGPTFGFGAGRAGDVSTLSSLGQQHGFEVIVVERLTMATDGKERTVSSSAIRAAISSGRVAEAARMLSRLHEIGGVVGHGAGRGAGLGYPTINLEQIQELLPGHGVYAAIVELPDGMQRKAAVNIGYQPTFETTAYRVEAHLLNHEASLRAARIRLRFVERLRDQVRFESIEALKRQLAEDVQRVDSLVAITT
jgi:riboflavin kinase/FMN adenylyltransferase